MTLDPPEPITPKPPAAELGGSEDSGLWLEPIAPGQRRTPRTGLWIAGGLGLVLMGVLTLGVALPDDNLPDMAAPGAQTLDIRVAERPQAPAPPSPPGAPLEVLSDEMAAAAPHNPPAVYAPPPEVEVAQAPPPAPRRAEDLRQPASLSFSPSFDCRRARTPAERVVCADPALAEADQQLAAAYDLALAAGVPGWRLERQQRRWLRAREDAARDAPAAVAEVYAARIAEIEDQADTFAPFEAAPPEAPSWPPSW